MQKIDLIEVDSKDSREINHLFSLIQENYNKTAHPLTKEELTLSSKKFFWAKVEGNIIGTSGISFKTPTLVETIKSVVAKEFRGRGYGKKISQAIEDKCIELGVTKITSTIYSDNHAMIAIKLQQGYIIEGYHPHHEAPGFHEYSLGKVLKT